MSRYLAQARIVHGRQVVSLCSTSAALSFGSCRMRSIRSPAGTLASIGQVPVTGGGYPPNPGSPSLTRQTITYSNQHIGAVPRLAEVEHVAGHALVCLAAGARRPYHRVVPNRTVTRILGAVALIAAAMAPAPAVAAGPPGAGQHGGGAGRLQVGRVSLRRCAKRPLTFCGRIRVPLDYSSVASPDIGIGFHFLPATGPHATGTVLAVEGGPGFATTGTQPQYLAMMGPLRRTRNLLLVNLRGTGNSTPVDCPGLEHAGPRQSGSHFNELVAACGRQLNHTWHYRGGGWVHASDLFNTAYSARDVEGVVRALKLGRVDLYGDSYGSWFAQVFASRYPAQLRSVTLDSTYQVLDLKPWYTTTVVTARRAFAQACRLSVACAAATRGDGSAWARISALAARLARAPVTGETALPDGRRGKLTVTALTLVNLVNNAGFDPVVYRDLDAAGRALLRGHDAAPLLRIAALSLGFDDTNYPLPEFSDGLYFAVGCTDYVQLFSRTAPPAVRARQYLAALRREPKHVFAPFSLTQWTSLDQYTEAYSACLRWPTPDRLVPPIVRKPPLVPRRLPVLIMSGTLDSLTPRLHGATLVARQMGPSARLVTFANLTHVMLQDANDACPASVYQRFVLDPGDLHHENTSCARRVTPVHTVGSYPRLLADAAPAKPLPGNTAGRRARQAASVAVAAVGDEISRYPLLSGRRDLGLRGGRVTFTPGSQLLISLRNVRWVTNAWIDGTAQWNQSSGWVRAQLTVHSGAGPAVRLTARWRPFGAQDQPAVIHGFAGKRRLAAASPAP
jgi:pimeloyl-ACP methyl ester carboxylesterase